VKRESCPTAPFKRAASLLWYAQQHGASLSAASAQELTERVKAACKTQILKGPIKDLSCRSTGSVVMRP
jgi:hypothetical protein